MSQLTLFDSDSMSAWRAPEREPDDAETLPRDAEVKAARWARQLIEEEGWQPEQAIARAEAAYGISRRRPEARAGLGAGFRRRVLEAIAGGRNNE